MSDPFATASRLDNDFIEIPSRKFYGRCASSPDGRFMLAWHDGNDAGTVGGARASGKGRYILLDNGTVVSEGRMERPNDGKVANNGTFIFNDWRFFTGQPRGTFYAFRADGSEILRRKYKANLYNSGLSRDGRYSVCQTCNSPEAGDSAILSVFDLERATELTTWQAESGWANSYEFSGDGQFIWLVYPRGPKLTYRQNGEFLDRKLWIDASLDRGDLPMVARMLKEISGLPGGEFAKRLAASVDVGLKLVRADDDRTLAWALKLQATCLDGLHESASALDCYERALALDPKIGVKRRVDQLRKRLGLAP